MPSAAGEVPGAGAEEVASSAGPPGHCGPPAGWPLRPPQAMLQCAPGAGLELLRIGLGRSQVAPEKRDKRFADQAWQRTPRSGR